MHFVIAGAINCPQFSYAVMVAQRLKENLPDFTYLKIPKKPEEWPKWLVNTCRENHWYHNKSPIIWREIGVKQGKKDFIGDINKFLDLCYDYYGIPHEVLSAENFSRGEMNWFTKRTESEFFEKINLESKKRRKYRSRQVCITGASNPVAEIVIMELLQIELQRREDGLEIRLFDDLTKEKKLSSSANDAKHCPGPSGFGNCRVVTTLKEAFTDIDLVIVLDSFARKNKEPIVKWLKRNRNAMCALGKSLNMYAPAHCRVIIGSRSSQPLCYNATVLASFATKLHVRNIVAVTQDLGREMLNFLSKESKVPLKNFFCPPVWGFVGLNKYIDVRRTLQTFIYKKPVKHLNSTFPRGSEEYELRTSESLISEDDAQKLHVKVSDHKAETFPQLGRWPCLAKATAIVDLLKVWGLKQEDGNGEILCLGVYSDGTFNIPQGIYWSQPVILSNGFWVPFPDFPIPRSPFFNCYSLFLYSIASLYRTKVKPRIYISPNRTPKPKKSEKYDFNKIVEEVGVPVIRTDAECLIYLKHLAKKELGLDFDAIEDYFEEEIESDVSPPEDIVKEHIYCECWRQELKNLQKYVFTRSSTTEVEVDLSENLSVSEWSVINPKSKIELQSNVSEEESVALFPPRQNFLLNMKSSKDDDISGTICSCGLLSTNSLCKCLTEPSKQILDDASTEHFYKQQNPQIFHQDEKDIIYADNYTEVKKNVSFDPKTVDPTSSGSPVKFYGKKDAMRDLEAEIKMRKRISRYERGSEESIEEEENFLVGEDDVESSPEKLNDIVDKKSIKLMAEKQDGLQDIDDTEKYTEKKSSHILKEAVSDNIEPPVQVLLSDVEKSSKSFESDFSFHGESYFDFGNGLQSFPAEEMGEDQFSMTSIENDLNSVWNKEFEGESEEKKTKESEPDNKKKLRRKIEGIPLCCLCRCLVPEGLPCCPCGASTVVEVFKKESIEVFIQSEDDISYRIEYMETSKSQEKVKSEIILVNSEPEPIDLPVKELPPESFQPFSPKPKNKFFDSARPFQLTKEYADSFKKKSKQISPECLELLTKAKAQLEDENRINEKGEIEDDETIEEERKKKDLLLICDDLEQIKKEFSDLKLFIPCGLEDWRLTVQKNYQEWFFQGPKVKGDAYYDIAIEDVSEDEFEVDKEIEQFFEK